MINFDNYTYLYNADAYFKAEEKYPDGFFQTLLRRDKQGFDAVCWGLAELSMQGELVRRYQGCDAEEYLTEEKVRHFLDIKEVPRAVEVLVDAITKGLSINSKEDEEIDEVLMELQKKTESDSPNPNS